MGAALAPVRLGFGTMLELVGEAGVGKTRLLQEFKSTAATTSGGSARAATSTRARRRTSSSGTCCARCSPELDGTAGRERRRRCARSSQRVAPGSSARGSLSLGARRSTSTSARHRRLTSSQPAFRRARLHGVVEELLNALLPRPDARPARRRALDRRGLVRAASAPRRDERDAAVGDLLHATSRRRRVRRRERRRRPSPR